MDGTVNILSLDGGGIRGVSMLIILDQIMKRIQHDENLPEIPRPCEYFQLIGGTGTGGLIALMLGRLKMSTQEALQKYSTLSESIFGWSNRKAKHKDGEFKASTLENLIRNTVAERQLGEYMRPPENDSSIFPKTFVCAVPAANMAHPRLFRSYAVRENTSPDCKIWEAARATTAAPLFFKRISIEDENGVKEEFLDGALLHNNPAQLALDEAFRTFGSCSRLGCLVSLGTGHPGTVGLSKPDAFQKILPIGMIGVLKRTATDCEQTAHELAGRFRKSHRYFRYSVSHGVGNVSLEEWGKIGEISSHTKSYLEDVEVSNSVDRVVEILCRRSGVGGAEIQLQSICEAIPTPETLLLETAVRHQHPSTSLFTGREDYISALEAFFTAQRPETSLRREYLLYGMGGAGKTQIALRFAENYRSRYDRVFWLDATNKDTLIQGYQSIASKIDMAPRRKYSLDEALQSLINYEGRWLLLFDGADMLAEIKDHFPPGLYGDIIYTSKNSMLRKIPEEHTKCVSNMTPEEAITLLLKSARLNTSSTLQKDLVSNIVKELGYLALAIDQAGAYIASGECNLDDFLETFYRSRQLLLQEEAYKGASIADQAVYTTWDLSYAAIVRQAESTSDESLTRGPKAALQILQVLPFLHNENISEKIFQNVAEYTDTDAYAHKSPRPYSDFEERFMSSICLCTNGTWDILAFRQGIRTLLSFSLIQRNDSAGRFSLHRLVHLWSFDRLSAVEKDLYWSLARRLLTMSIYCTGTKTDEFAFCRDILSHINACQKRAFKCSVKEEDDWKTTVLRVLLVAGRLSEAEKLAKDALAFCRENFGEEDSRTCGRLWQLVVVYYQQQKFGVAIELSENFLRNHKNRGSEVCSYPLRVMSCMRMSYLGLGRTDKASELQLQIFNARQKGQALPYLDPSWRTSDSPGAPQVPSEAAIASQLRTLENEPSALGTADKDISTELAILAFIYLRQNRLDEAESLLLRTLEIKKKVFGIEHRETLSSMTSLINVYHYQDRLDEAKRLNLQVLEAQEKVFGIEHPATLYSMSGLASIYRRQNQLDEAERLESKVLEIRKKIQGIEHPETLSSMITLTIIYYDQNRLDKAERLGSQVFEEQKKLFGIEHPTTLRTFPIYAITLHKHGRHAKAIELMKECVHHSISVLGAEHEDTQHRMRVFREWTRTDASDVLQITEENEDGWSTVDEDSSSESGQSSYHSVQETFEGHGEGEDLGKQSTVV